MGLKKILGAAAGAARQREFVGSPTPTGTGTPSVDTTKDGRASMTGLRLSADELERLYQEYQASKSAPVDPREAAMNKWADLWESHVKSGKSPDEATRLVEAAKASAGGSVDLRGQSERVTSSRAPAGGARRQLPDFLQNRAPCPSVN